MPGFRFGKPAERPSSIDLSKCSGPADKAGALPSLRKNTLLGVDQLSVCFPDRAGPVWAARKVSLQIARGEIAALVGESGSGKSVIALSILRLVPPPGRIVGGDISFDGRNLLTLDGRAMTDIRGGQIGWISQTPRASLNPSFKVGDQIASAVARHDHGTTTQASRERTMSLLDQLGFADPYEIAPRFPHELSGGMCQRVAIAIALAGRPSLLIADEPTTALDVAIQAQILGLLRQLNQDTGLTILMITHDLALVKALADRAIVLQRGEVLEAGDTSKILSKPAHPYTQALLAAVPDWSQAHTAAPLSSNSADTERTPDRSRQSTSDRATVLVEARGITKRFAIPALGFGRTGSKTVVDRVDLQIEHGQTLALVGESGSGKSTLGRLLVGLTAADAGDIRYDRADRGDAVAQRSQALNRGVQIVFQDPLLSLNPRRTIGQSIARPLENIGVGRAERPDRIAKLLKAVRLDPSHAERYPGEISGGQCQRVAIARALALEPRFIVLDEPVSALDVSVQAEILSLLLDLQQERGLTYLFITHDLRLVPMMAQDVAVMHRGRIVETGRTRSVLDAPKHAYTKRLLDSVLRLDVAPDWEALATYGALEEETLTKPTSH